MSKVKFYKEAYSSSCRGASEEDPGSRKDMLTDSGVNAMSDQQVASMGIADDSYAGSNLIGGLQWVDEPKVLRFFFGRLEEIGYWQEELAKKFREDFGESL